MVYDLGGGTFDVSILEISNGVIEVLATAGNNQLGGDDFDACIVRELTDAFKKQHRVDLARDPVAMERVREAAEKAKIELSAMTETSVSLPYLAVGKHGPVHMEQTLTRARFNELTAHLVQQTAGPVRQAMADSGLTVKDLGKVLMVGGSSRIPAVQDMVKDVLGMTPFKGINPDECVALGAALQGGVLAGDVKALLLLDVTPLSLGIETMGGVCTRVIERNTAIPIRKSQIFTTAANFQTSVDVHVLQGERPMANQNKELGRFQLTGIRRAMRGVPQIEVTFAIDANGIVNVSAKDLGTGQVQDITITATSNMSSEEIDRAVREAQQYAREDACVRETAGAKDRAERAVYLASSVKLGRQCRARSAELVRAVKRAIKSGDADAMNRTADDLEMFLREVGCREFDGQYKPTADDVMDAEFEPVGEE